VNDGIKLKLLLNNQPTLVKMIEDAEKSPMEVVVCDPPGFHNDRKVHDEIVAYFKSLGCTVNLVKPRGGSGPDRASS